MEITFERTGGRPVLFDGEMLLETAPPEDRYSRNRWYTARLARTAAGKLVVEVNYTSTWRNRKGVAEPSRHEVKAGTADEVTRWLMEFDPLAAQTMRIPPGALNAKARRMVEERTLRAQWEEVRGQVLLALAGPERLD